MRNTKIAAVALLAAAAGGCMRPYNEPEFVDVAPNETAFVIRLDGENNTSDGQAKLLSEAYLEANRVAAKRIEITHRWVDTGYAHDAGRWIPDVEVVKVDRSAVTRQWTEEGGTSPRNEAVSIESKDSVGFSVGFTCTAYIREEDAAKYLYTHPSGSLATVMDTEVLGRIQRDCQLAVNGFSLAEVPEHKADLQKAVESDVIPWFATRGVTITNVGMFGGLHYENPAIQRSIDDAAAASNLKIVAQAKFEAQQKENQRIELEAEGAAQAARSKAQGEADAKLLIAQAEAKSITAVQDALAKVQNPQMVLSLRQLEIANTQAERWNGQYPQWYMGGGAATPQLMLNVPPPMAATATAVER